MDYKLWIGFVQYIREKSGKVTRDYAHATALIIELKRCRRENRWLSSYWQLMAQKLFADYKISDPRITFDEPLRAIEYEIDGKQYKTEISYIMFDIDKFPAESRVVINANGKDEKEFAINTMRSFIKRYPNVDTSKIFSYQNCLNIIVNE